MTFPLRPLALIVALAVAGCDSTAPPPGGPPVTGPPSETLTATLVDPAMVKEVVAADCVSFHDADPDAPLSHIPLSDARRGACDPALPLTDPAGRLMTAAEWAGASGTVAIACVGDGTEYRFTFEGLVPGGVYTVWHFPPTGEGALASSPGEARNVFTAQAGTTTVLAFGRAGPMTIGGSAPACTLPVPPRADVGALGGELFVVLYHKDGRHWGDLPGPEETTAGHLVFMGR